VAQKIINIPTINDRNIDFEQLLSIWNQSNDYFENIRFDFSSCNFLRPNAVAFLGGLARLIESRMGSVVFDWSTLPTHGAVITNLCQNGFAGVFGYPSSSWDGNSIPYREDRTLDMNVIMDHLTYNWIGKGWVHLLKEFVRVNHGKLEVYSNEGYGIIDENGERFQNCSISFEGTVFHITLRCDESLYQFADEAQDDMPF